MLLLSEADDFNICRDTVTPSTKLQNRHYTADIIFVPAHKQGILHAAIPLPSVPNLYGRIQEKDAHGYEIIHKNTRYCVLLTISS
jgi:hypothetical protein